MEIKNLILAGLIGATLTISVAPSPTVEAYAGITSERERQIGKTASKANRKNKRDTKSKSQVWFMYRVA